MFFFDQMSVSLCFSFICPFGDMSFRSDVFGLYVHSVIFFFGHASIWPNVFRPYVRSAFFLSAICLTTAAGRLTTSPSTFSHVQNTLPIYPPWINGDGLERRQHNFCRRGPALNECDQRDQHPSLPQPSDDGREGYDDDDDDQLICV